MNSLIQNSKLKTLNSPKRPSDLLASDAALIAAAQVAHDDLAARQVIRPDHQRERDAFAVGVLELLAKPLARVERRLDLKTCGAQLARELQAGSGVLLVEERHEDLGDGARV